MWKWMLVLTGCSLVVDTSGLSSGGGPAPPVVDAGAMEAEPVESPVAAIDAGIADAALDAGSDANTAADADAAMPLPPDLVAAWTFEAGATDATGNGHNGTIGNANSAFGLEIRDAAHIDYYQGDGYTDGHIATSPVSLSTQSWSHVALVVAGASVKLYLDGALVGASTAADTTSRTATELTLGASAGGDHLNAVLDNVRYYARALSDAEVTLDRGQ